jgi:rRNA maturation protein Rpf1
MPCAHLKSDQPHAQQVLVTTSRDPSSKLASFAKEIALVIPNAKAQNRGSVVLDQLVASARASSITDIIVAHEHRCAVMVFFFLRHDLSIDDCNAIYGCSQL